MKHKLKATLLGLITMTALVSSAYSWFTTSKQLQAPDIDFKIVDGRTLNLRQLSGQPVLIIFWATSCVACIKEIPHLIELYHELAPQGLEIIGVAMSYDPPSQVMEIRKRKQIPYPIALDIQNKVTNAFGDVSLTPTTFLIDPNGRIVLQKTGMLNMTNIRQLLQSMLSVPQGG